jgi:hypothetical protein
VIAHLPPGLYDVRAVPTIASGYTAATRRSVQVQPGGATVIDVAVPRATVVGALPRVPDLFNLGLQDALVLLASRGLAPGQVLAAHGQVITITAGTDAGGRPTYTAPAEFAARPVINSEPSENMELAPGATVGLLISTSDRSDV